MAKQTINVGTTANDGTGSTIRAGGQFINANFSEIYTAIGNGSTLNVDTSGATANQVLKFDAATSKFIPGSGSSASFTLAGSAGSAQTLSDTDTITIAAGTGITTTAGATDTVTVAIDNTVATLTGSQVITNKTISGSSNTISNIGNSSLTNSSITLVDDTSSSTTISLGESLKLSGDTGITTTISGDTINIDLDDTSVTPNTYGSSSAVPVITIDQQGRITSATTSAISTTLTIADDTSSLATIDLASDTLKIAGGTGITSVVSGDTITLNVSNIQSEDFVDKILQTSASIDVTASGSSAYLFNSHYSGNNPTLYLRAGQTYALNLNVSGHPFHLQTVSGAYSSGNPYTTGLTHVATNGTVTTGASALLQVTGTLYIEVPSGSSSSIFYACQNHGAMAGKIVLGPITDTFTGDGSTVAFTINSGRNVNDVLAIVNGIILVPTTDYTISTTTLTFNTAPAASAEIQVRYL